MGDAAPKSDINLVSNRAIHALAENVSVNPLGITIFVGALVGFLTEEVALVIVAGDVVVVGH